MCNIYVRALIETKNLQLKKFILHRITFDKLIFGQQNIVLTYID